MQFSAQLFAVWEETKPGTQLKINFVHKTISTGKEIFQNPFNTSPSNLFVTKFLIFVKFGGLCVLGDFSIFRDLSPTNLKKSENPPKLKVLQILQK